MGRAVAAARTASGLSKVEFALKLGVSRPLLDAIEAGRANVKLSTLERIAERMDVEPWELIR